MSKGASRHLLNPLAELDQPTPSSLDHVPALLERDLRAYGALLIQQLGVLLHLPQVVSSTACVLYQRFWFVTSFKHFSLKDIALGALFLSSKLEESPLRLRDLINCSAFLFQRIEGKEGEYKTMDYFATEFYDTKDAVVVAEMQILKRLAFQTQTGLPYGHLINYLKVLELSEEREFVRRCWGYCNDFLQTPSPALYPQSTLAVASIYLSVRLHPSSISLPLSPVPWWELFDCTETDLIRVCESLLGLYRDWGEEKEDVWRKVRELPVGKEGVRKEIARAVAEKTSAAIDK